MHVAEYVSLYFKVLIHRQNLYCLFIASFSILKSFKNCRVNAAANADLANLSLFEPLPVALAESRTMQDFPVCS